MSFLNASGKEMTRGQSHLDPVYVAAQIQRWFIAIHPFDRGNGRMSRFIMELVLKSIGLPPPILFDMNEDMYVTEKEWAAEVGRGIHRAIVFAEACSYNPKIKGCAVITQLFGANGGFLP